MSDLPENWKMTTLENVCSQISDGTHKTPNYVATGVPFISIANITPFKPIDWNSYVRFITQQEHKELTKRCKPERDDVLITRIGTLGKAKRVDVDIEFSIFVGLGLLKPIKEIVDPRYLEAWMNSPEIRELNIEKATGSGRQTLALQETRILPIPLPPLAEQKRIADKLDSLHARVDSCQAHLARIPQILKRFRQSVLAAATSGRLTVTDFGSDNANYLLLSEIIERIKTGPFGSALHKSDYIANGVPLVNPMHINGGRITPSNEITITEKMAKQLQEYRLAYGDVILARRGIMGRCAVVGTKEEGWLCGSGSMILHPTQQVLPEYLQIFLSSPLIVANLEADSVGSTMSNLNQKILLALTIRVPSNEEQQEIVRRVEALFALADRLEARWKSVQGRVGQLTPSLLAKAFRGELVEQDPNDEPAGVMLEKIMKTKS